MIAVMIAAAMCVVPLFVAEDSEAINVDTDKSGGISFKAGSVSDADFAKLTGGTSKTIQYQQYASQIMRAVVEDSYYFTVDASSVKISNVKDVRLAAGTNITKDTYETTNATEMTFDVEFKATADLSGELFSLYDGTQTLYNELGKTNRFASSNTLEFKGTATISQMNYLKCTIAKTYNNYYVATDAREKMCQLAEFSGDLTFNNGTAFKITIDEAKTLFSTDVTTEFDFYDVKPENLTAESKVMRTADGKQSMADVLKYKINDKSDGYDFSYCSDDIPSSLQRRTYSVSTVESLGEYLFKTDLTVPDYKYYTDLPSTYSFFNAASVSDDTLKDNDKMKSFLEDIGDVGDTFSTADSVADGAYSSVGASGGNNNIIFYVIIGVLAVAVVALAVLMIKKK